MSIARTTEIVASSPDGFKAAMKEGVARANKTLDNLTGAWVQDQELVLDGGKIKEYRVRMKVTFILKG